MVEQNSPTPELKNLIENSNRILITSHISPDPDAICATLLMGKTLELGFPDKEVRMILEEEPNRDLSFLTGYKEIVFGNILKAAKDFRPGLFIILDAMNFQRVSRSDGAELKKLVTDELRAQLAIIDHHTDIGLEKSDVYINSHLPATAQEVYGLLFKSLELKKPEGYAQTALLGIVSDTARFKYENPAHRQTFEVVNELLDAGASIEALEYRLERYTRQQMAVFSVLSKYLIDSGKGYSYTYLDLADIGSSDSDAVKTACEIFTVQFIRNIENNYWGFIVYPEQVNGKTAYSVSLRSAAGTKDVSEIAGMLGGGGHRTAAGAKGIGANSAIEAIKKVQSVIDA